MARRKVLRLGVRRGDFQDAFAGAEEVLEQKLEAVSDKNMNRIMSEAAERTAEFAQREYANADYPGDASGIIVDHYASGKTSRIIQVYGSAAIPYIEYGAGKDRGPYPGKTPKWVISGSNFQPQYGYRFKGRQKGGKALYDKIELKDQKFWYYYGEGGKGGLARKVTRTRRTRPHKEAFYDESYTYQNEWSARENERIRMLEERYVELGKSMFRKSSDHMLTLPEKLPLFHERPIPEKWAHLADKPFRQTVTVDGEDYDEDRTNRRGEQLWSTEGNEPAAVMFYAKERLREELMDVILEELG